MSHCSTLYWYLLQLFILFEYINQFEVLYSENQFCTINISSNILFDLFICFTQTNLVILVFTPTKLCQRVFLWTAAKLVTYQWINNLARFCCLFGENLLYDQFEYSHAYNTWAGTSKHLMKNSGEARVCDQI